jgi:hypothetical protein
MIGAKCNLKDRFAKRFLTLDGEQLIYSTRQHWFTLLPSFALNVLFVIFVFLIVISLYTLAPDYFLSSLLLALILLTIIAEIFIKELVEWYFHFYIITNRKIVEVTYKPLNSRAINEVLLDQVRCTEVDVEMRGMLSEVLNIGSVILTFDRPTHEETFTIKKIKGPRRIAMHLGDSFEAGYENRIWYKGKENRKYSHRFIEELSPNTNYQLGGL